MKILSIDTSTKFLSLGIFDDSKIYEVNLEVGRKLSVLLTITIQRALEAAALTPGDIDVFSCGLGPGSFTGMRTGVAAVKGLSWALKKPVVGISTLDILAKNVKDSGRPIVAAVDAKRNLIYAGVFKNKNGALKKTGSYKLLNEEEFLKIVPAESLVLGDALNLYRDNLIKHIKGVTLLDKDYWYPKAHHQITLTLERIREKKFGTCFDIEPIYLYPKECQIRQAKIK